MAELSGGNVACSNEYVLKFCEHVDSLIPFASINPYLVSDMRRASTTYRSRFSRP